MSDVRPRDALKEGLALLRLNRPEADRHSDVVEAGGCDLNEILLGLLVASVHKEETSGRLRRHASARQRTMNVS